MTDEKHIQKVSKAGADRLGSILYPSGDPLRDAPALIKDWKLKPWDMIFFVGLGLGHLPLYALEKNSAGPRMVIIEPLAQVFAAARAHADLSPLLDNDRVDIYTGDTVSIAQIVSRYQEIIPVGVIRLIIHPNYDKLLGQKILAIKQELTERIRAVRDNAFNTRDHGRRMFENSVANLPSLFQGSAMRDLRGKFKGVAAVCVAAGPSLDQALPKLKSAEKNALLISCDSAVASLLNAGIRPHVVVTTDIFEVNIEKLRPHLEALRGTVLLYGIESNPDNVRLYLCAKRAAVSAYSKLLLLRLDPLLNLQSGFPAMNSVSHMAIFAALAFGCDPLVMVGMDLSYAKGRSHAAGSVFLHSLVPEKVVRTYGNRGYPVPSSPQFIADKLLIERVIVTGGQRFINTSLSGAYVEGTSVKRLSEVVDDFNGRPRPDLDALMETIEWQPVCDEIRAKTVVEGLIREFEAFSQECGRKKEELLGRIDRMRTNHREEQDRQAVADIEAVFNDFQKQHADYAQMSREVMLADLYDLLRKQEALSLDSGGSDASHLTERLALVAGRYELFEKAMAFQIEQLKRFESFSAGPPNSLMAKKSDWENHLDRARRFDRKSQLWLAAREYRRCMDIDPARAEPYLELARAFIHSALWQPAREVIQKMPPTMKDSPEAVRLGEELCKGIDGIFAAIKKAWMIGNISSTRKMLHQYLLLRPEDREANELKRVIGELDQEFSAWFQEETVKEWPPDMSTRLEQAENLIRNRRFEQTVGILEGLIEEFPQSNDALRERIGDIRLEQKDMKSALWNFSKALALNPNAPGLEAKIGNILKFQMMTCSNSILEKS